MFGSFWRWFRRCRRSVDEEAPLVIRAQSHAQPPAYVEDDEVLRLRAALARAMDENQRLRNELTVAEEKVTAAVEAQHRAEAIATDAYRDTAWAQVQTRLATHVVRDMVQCAGEHGMRFRYIVK